MPRILLLATLFLLGCPGKRSDDTGSGDIDADRDGHSSLQDCDDADPNVFPGATETCNGVDDDCDGLVDEDDPGLEGRIELALDADGDGWGSMEPLDADSFCEHPGEGWVSDATDCDDEHPDIHPEATEYCNGWDDDCDGEIDEEGALDSTWYIDQDGDGFGCDDATLVQCEQPSGYVLDDSDCDDGDASVHPDADETCNDVDDDCDGAVDNDAVDESTWYRDSDNDGYGDDGDSTTACDEPPMHTARGGDCDDDDITVNPGATELCNDVDDDCDGSIDEDASNARTWYADADGDGHGDATDAIASCDQPTGRVGNAADCDDGDASIHPGATEHCDGVDEDCDGVVDDNAVDESSWYADSDGDGYGDASHGTTACEQPTGTTSDDTDCNDADDTVHPGADEHCDGVDEDCDGATDDNPVDGTTWYTDGDGDGYGDSSSSTTSCVRPSGSTGTGGDCDDTDATVNPGAIEHCDGVDNDCSGTADDGGAATFVSSSGTTTDYGSVLGAGTASSAASVNLNSDGTLTICDGTFYVYLQVKTSNLEIVGYNGSGGTVLASDGTQPVVEAFGSSSVLGLDGLTLSGGYGSSGGGVDGGSHGLDLELQDVVVDGCEATGSGGGIYQQSGTITATDLVLSNNVAGSYGGGMYVYNTDVTLDTVTVQDNEAGGSGGGLFLDLTTSSLDTVTMDGNLSGGYGGGAYIRYADATLEACSVSSNEASYGGGLMFYDSEASSSDLDVSGNTSSGGPGGGVYLSFSEFTLDGGVVTANEAVSGESYKGVGGGLFLNNGSEFSCLGSSSATEGVYQNVSDTFGGGVLIYDEDSEMSSDSCDWGTGSSDNSPDDVGLFPVTYAYASYGGNESFSCDASSCW